MNIAALLLDAGYLLAALLLSPIWLIRMIRSGKIRTDWRARFGRGAALPKPVGPRVLLHAVSVGEVNATRNLIEELKATIEHVEIVVATTTDTGYARAVALYDGLHHVVRFPFDLSWAVGRFLRRVQPDCVGLMELEVWPNFLGRCRRRSIPVAILNGRLSERSFRRYLKLPMWARRRLFVRGLSTVGVQDETYAERFGKVGVPEAHILITGTVKWDTAAIADEVEGAVELGEALGIDPGRPLVVAGSTCPPEHELVERAVGEGAQLLCAPRKPEWFDAAARAFPGCARRSRGDHGSPTGRFLLDTIGELRQAYALADVVVVGRTFSDLGGSDMIEPIALGKATIVGPDCRNFERTAELLRVGGGVQEATRETLRSVVEALLHDEPRRRALAEGGRAVIRAHQGASRRSAEILRELLGGVE